MLYTGALNGIIGAVLDTSTLSSTALSVDSIPLLDRITVLVVFSFRICPSISSALISPLNLYKFLGGFHSELTSITLLSIVSK